MKETKKPTASRVRTLTSSEFPEERTGWSRGRMGRGMTETLRTDGTNPTLPEAPPSPRSIALHIHNRLIII